MKAVLISVLYCWLVTGNGFAQPANPSAKDGSTNLLSVQIWPQLSREVFRAPATIHISAFVTLRAPARAGDVVRVEFFANTNSLGSRAIVWHDAISPQPRPSQAVPMLISAPGFSPAEIVWSNVSSGDYALTARATGANGLSAVSAPVKITVLP